MKDSLLPAGDCFGQAGASIPASVKACVGFELPVMQTDGGLTSPDSHAVGRPAELGSAPQGAADVHLGVAMGPRGSGVELSGASASREQRRFRHRPRSDPRWSTSASPGRVF